MSDGMFSAIILGTVVDGSIAVKFRKAIEPYSTEQVIKDFVYAIANGDLKIKEVEK